MQNALISETSETNTQTTGKFGGRGSSRGPAQQLQACALKD